MPPTPKVDLVSMTADEYSPWLEKLIIEYAEEQVVAGRWSAEEAVTESRSNVTGILPDGPATADQHLWTARDSVTGERVGVLWVEVRPRAGTTEAYINDIEVDAGHRGRGYGRAIMDACAARARELGATRVGLQVAGHNAVARKLYASLGYQEASIQMRLDL
jgi:ribosomal protein S18 acetylase RimI-like enzyme